MSERNLAVLAAIQEAEQLMESSGVRALCTACWARTDPDNPKPGGCCSGCQLSAPTGCLNKPLSCTLWLCSYATNKYPGVAAKLLEIGRRFPWEIANGHRMISLHAEKKL